MLNSVGMEMAVVGGGDLSPGQGVCTRHRMVKSQWGSALVNLPVLGDATGLPYQEPSAP